jgi:hypothetical protein
MTDRNLTQELLYNNYVDMENGDDVESIDYRSLIHIITELKQEVEELKSQVNDLQKIVTAHEYVRNIGL